MFRDKSDKRQWVEPNLQAKVITFITEDEKWIQREREERERDNKSSKLIMREPRDN